MLDIAVLVDINSFFKTWNTSFQAFLACRVCAEKSEVISDQLASNCDLMFFSWGFEQSNLALYVKHFNYNVLWRGSFFIWSTWGSQCLLSLDVYLIQVAIWSGLRLKLVQIILSFSSLWYEVEWDAKYCHLEFCLHRSYWACCRILWVEFQEVGLRFHQALGASLGGFCCGEIRLAHPWVLVVANLCWELDLGSLGKILLMEQGSQSFWCPWT